MKCYVACFGYDYEGDDVLGVAASLDGAKAIAQGKQDELAPSYGQEINPLGWKAEANGKAWRGAVNGDFSSNGWGYSFSITEHNLAP